MASQNSPQFVFKFGDACQKPYELGFPGLAFPSLQNPLEEVGLHKQLSKTLDDLNTRGLGETTLVSKNKGSLEEQTVTDQDVTPKAQKQKPTDVKRWASVVKAQKKLHLTSEPNVNDKHQHDTTEITSEIFDCIFQTFPKCFESHKGFFVVNDKRFYCNICSLNSDSVLSLSNHLKTRKHEDSAIEYFKSQIPTHLHCIMEFVSFHGSNLCCNLCQTEIVMSSLNPYETIVNIMAHNNGESHCSKKVNHETCNNAEKILQALSKSSNIIMENLHLIEKKMVPEFKCQLCKITITYDDNREVLSQHFIAHLKSAGHAKNQKAVEVLKLFGEANITSKDNWSVTNGSIMCTYCNCEIETNLQQLISHANDFDHATKVLSKLGISSSFNKVSENNTVEENMINEAKSSVLTKPKKGESDKKQPPVLVTTQSKIGTRLKELLNTMPSGLRDVDYVIENEKGSITCSVCSRVVPPSTYNLRTHLLGNKHKLNLELRNKVPIEECTSSGKSSQNNISGGSVNAIKTSSEALKLQKVSLVVQHSSKLHDNVLKKDKDSVTCTLCKSTFPSQSIIDEHFKSEEHKKREHLWLNNCSGCLSRNPFTSRVLQALNPIKVNSIRINMCRQTETIPASVLNHLYSLLLKENQLIKLNENILIKNVDGKNTYCKLCKALIPLSLDVDVLESNIVSHLREKRHERLFSEKNENRQAASISPKVVKSLFSLPQEMHTLKKDSKAFNFEEFTRLIQKNSDVKTNDSCSQPFSSKLNGRESHQNLQESKGTEHLNLETEQKSSAKKKVNDDVFIFGNGKSKVGSLGDLKNGKESKSAGQNESLPVAHVTRQVKFEEETDEEVLSRRQKQINYGKNTEGYARYSKLIPHRKRGIIHPVTPPKYLRCSRRTWDGMIRAWRRQLHSWDPPSSTLDSDIRPLD